jgi:hypothetical protein
VLGLIAGHFRRPDRPQAGLSAAGIVLRRRADQARPRPVKADPTQTDRRLVQIPRWTIAMTALAIAATADLAQARTALDRQVIRVRSSDAQQMAVGVAPRGSSSWCWGAHGLEAVVGGRHALRYARSARRTPGRANVIRRADPRAIAAVLDPTCRFSLESISSEEAIGRASRAEIAFRSPATAPLVSSPVPGSVPPDVSPAWAPDGRFAAVVPNGAGQKRSRVVVETATGRVVATVSGSYEGGGFSAQAFSPDGTAVAHSVEPLSHSTLRILDLKTGGIRTVATEDPPRNPYGGWTAPSWSPDGRTLAATDIRGWITLVDIASGAQSTIQPRWFPAGPPLWSPDGRWLAYRTAGDVESKSGIEIAAVAPGATPRLARLRPWSGIDAGPFWLPDSSGVVIVKR